MNNVLELVVIDEQYRESIWSIVFDHDINAYKGNIPVVNFKFPLFTNLVKLQESNLKMKDMEIMFSCNNKDTVHVFVYNVNQKMYSSKYNSVRLNEDMILEILYKYGCDEATLYFNGHKFEYIYQTDNEASSLLSSLWNVATCVPVKLVYLLVLIYKGLHCYMWIKSIMEQNINIADIHVD